MNSSRCPVIGSSLLQTTPTLKLYSYFKTTIVVDVNEIARGRFTLVVVADMKTATSLVFDTKPLESVLSVPKSDLFNIIDKIFFELDIFKIKIYERIFWIKFHIELSDYPIFVEHSLYCDTVHFV